MGKGEFQYVARFREKIRYNPVKCFRYRLLRNHYSKLMFYIFHSVTKVSVSGVSPKSGPFHKDGLILKA